MSKGARFQVVASGCRQAAHMYLGVRVGIDDLGGLRGSRIGVLSVGSCPSWIVQKILTVHGLDPVRDVELVPLHEAYPQIVDWVANGQLDACLVTEPNLSIGEARGILKIWAAAYEPRYLPDFNGSFGLPMKLFWRVTQTLLRPYWKAATLRLTWLSRKRKPFWRSWHITTVHRLMKSGPPFGERCLVIKPTVS